MNRPQRFKVLLVFFWVTLFSNWQQPVTAQTEDHSILKIISQAKSDPFSAQFPQAAAVILLNYKAVVILSNDTKQTDIHLVIRLQNDAGIKKYGDLKFYYDSHSEEINIITARTINKEKEIVPVEPRAISVLTHPQAVNTPAYLNLKLKTISFPALEPGSIIELKLQKTQRTVKESNNPYFWGTEVFISTDPILKKQFVLKIPSAKSLFYTLKNNLPEPTALISDNIKTYSWQLAQIAPFEPAPHLPPITEISATLHYSTTSSWNSIGQWFGQRFQSQAETGPKMKQWVDETISGIKNREGKIQRIFFELSSKIRNVNLPLMTNGLSSRSSRKILENGYGTQLDKAILLVAMLKTAGIDAYPALAASKEIEIKKVNPALNLFGNIYILVPTDSHKHLLLNPADSSCRYGQSPSLTDFNLFVMENNKVSFLKKSGPSTGQNRLASTLNLSLNSAGDAKGNLILDYKGGYDCRIRRLKHASENKKAAFFQTLAGSLGEGTKNITSNISDLSSRTADSKVALEIEIPDFALTQGNMMILKFPPFITRYIPLNTNQKERKSDFSIAYNFSVHLKGEISLPPQYEALRVPHPVEVNHRFIHYAVKYQLNQLKRSIQYSFELKGESGIIPGESYAEFKQTMDQFKSRKNYLIILKKSK